MGSIHWAGPNATLEEMSTLPVIPRPHRGTHRAVGRKIAFGMMKASDVSDLLNCTENSGA